MEINLKQMGAVSNSAGAMEAEAISKNAANPKSQTSRENLLFFATDNMNHLKPNRMKRNCILKAAALAVASVMVNFGNANAQDAKNLRHLTVMNPDSSKAASFNIETLDGLKPAGNNVNIKMTWDGKQKSYSYPTSSTVTFDPREENYELRAETMQLDSAVTYTVAGKPAYKSDDDNYRWENNRWEKVDYNSSAPIIDFYPSSLLGNVHVWKNTFNYPGINTSHSIQIGENRKTTTDKNGNLTKIEVNDDNGGYYLTFLIKYNAYNEPVSIDMYNYDTHRTKVRYEYYDDHNRSLIEIEDWNYSTQQWYPNFKHVRKFITNTNRVSYEETYKGVDGKWTPSEKREVLYNSNDQMSRINHYEGVNDKWVQTYYTTFYYSDPESNETVAPLSISLSDGLLQVNTPQAERISVYSISGALLLSADKPAGEGAYGLPFHKGVFIVRGSSGWVRKAIAR